MAEEIITPVTDRLQKVENMLEGVVSSLDMFASILGKVPVVGNVITTVDAVGHVALGAIDAMQGDTSADAASLAAGSIAISTGNISVDSRLMEIETFIAAAAPLLAVIARHFGLTAPAAATPPAPMV